MKNNFFTEASREKERIRKLTNQQLETIKADPSLSADQKLKEMDDVLDLEAKKNKELSDFVFSKL